MISGDVTKHVDGVHRVSPRTQEDRLHPPVARSWRLVADWNNARALESVDSSLHARLILLLMWLGAFAESLRASVPAVGLGTTTAHRWTLVHQIYGSKSSPSWMSKCDNESMPRPWSEEAGLGMVKHHGAHPEDHLEDHPRHLGKTHGWKSGFCETSGTTQEEETASPRLWNDHNYWQRLWSISKGAQHKLHTKVASTTSTRQNHPDRAKPRFSRPFAIRAMWR